jgi:hypothetical protein
MSDSLTDDVHEWASQFCGVSTRDDASAPGDGSAGDGSTGNGSTGNGSTGDAPASAASPPDSSAPSLLGSVVDAVLPTGSSTTTADLLGGLANAVVDTANSALQVVSNDLNIDNAVGAAATAIDNSTAGKLLDPPKFTTRGLSGGERSYAHAIFYDTLNYDAITITGGGVATMGADLTDTECRTIGNSIGLSPDNFNPDGTLTDKGMETLIHEMTHSWQYQHGGWSYIRKALIAQGIAQAVQGDRNAAYDWQRLATAGTPWEQWNPEAQAKAVEDYNIALRAAQGGSTQSSVYQTLGELQPYLDQMTAGTQRGDYPDPTPDPVPG